MLTIIIIIQCGKHLKEKDCFSSRSEERVSFGNAPEGESSKPIKLEPLIFLGIKLSLSKWLYFKYLKTEF